MTDLTLTEAAAVAGVTPRQLRHAVTTGKLRARTVGRAYVVARADLDAWHPPAPGASLVAYWAARKVAGLAATRTALAAYRDGSGAHAVACEDCNDATTSGAAEAGLPTYAPALVRMRDGYLASAEVILGVGGSPDWEIDFGGFTAKRRDVAGFPSKSGGAFLYDEVD